MISGKVAHNHASFHTSHHTKGELPVKILAIMGIVVLVLVVLAAFIVPTGFRQTSLAEAQREFAEGCIRYRAPTVRENYLNAYEARGDASFINACETLQYGSRDYPNRCLERCPIDMRVSEEDLNRDTAEVIAGFTR